MPFYEDGWEVSWQVHSKARHPSCYRHPVILCKKRIRIRLIENSNFLLMLQISGEEILPFLFVSTDCFGFFAALDDTFFMRGSLSELSSVFTSETVTQKIRASIPDKNQKTQPKYG